MSYLFDFLKFLRFGEIFFCFVSFSVSCEGSFELKNCLWAIIVSMCTVKYVQTLRLSIMGGKKVCLWPLYTLYTVFSNIQWQLKYLWIWCKFDHSLLWCRLAKIIVIFFLNIRNNSSFCFLSWTACSFTSILNFWQHENISWFCSVWVDSWFWVSMVDSYQVTNRDWN